MSGVRVISFDGLNRSGKGVQISLLRKVLESNQVPVQVVRGDGSREGKGNPSYYDPQSTWWRRWQLNLEKTTEDWDRAHIVLNKELEDEHARFGYENPEGFFLMDRCYISRWFVERQRDKDVLFEDIVEKTHIFPELYFILDATKESLLERKNEDNPGKAEFRRMIVEQWYDLWIDTIKRVEDKLGDRLIRLNANKDRTEIHDLVIQNIPFYKTR